MNSRGQDHEAAEAPGLYVHVPFCARRCPYCDFYAVSALELLPRYVDGLAAEARLAAPAWPAPFETLYIGGGSPSILSREGLTGLLAALAPLDLSRLKEITLEANPEDVGPEQADLWAETGVTRLSLGVQSLDDRWLGEVLGRNHNPDQTLAAAALLKDRPFTLNFDLIYGLPLQAPADWGRDLTRTLELAPDHISTYSLTAAPGTALARSMEAGLLPPLPPPDQAAELFLLSGQVLAAAGFKRYEVSNFARPGFESRHNLKYWRRTPYLGLGPAAHSFDGRRRWANVSSVRRWASALSSGVRPLAFEEIPDEKAIRLEQVMLGLRLAEGLPEEALAAASRVDEFIASGHLTREAGRLRPTEKGFLVADRLAVELTE
ncbi:MAG: radical SAM family heme chaperone HemW [Candidatus Adiutrix sp.]|jgi:oxygen-independent coproporphyrinogen-3 oxidase|nr:radical SAM family heme chaperone HemW [Candidatus Adiutrix sp.]